MDKVRYYTFGFIPTKFEDDFLLVGGNIVRKADDVMDVQFTSDNFTFTICDNTLTVRNHKEGKELIVSINKMFTIHISD